MCGADMQQCLPGWFLSLRKWKMLFFSSSLFMLGYILAIHHLFFYRWLFCITKIINLCKYYFGHPVYLVQRAETVVAC